MKDNFNLFGFNLNTKKLIITIIIIFVLILLLIGIDILWFDVSRYGYGLLVGSGFLVAVLIASELAKERGLSKEFSYDIIWLVFPFAI